MRANSCVQQIDRSVECTSSATQALVMFRELYPGYRDEEIKNCIKGASKFIESKQRKDGTWYLKSSCLLYDVIHSFNAHTYQLHNRFGTWGVCFTYGTLFAVQGLVAAGRTYENSSSIRKACSFLLSKQLSTGGWGETYPSNETEVILNFLYLTMCLLGHFMFDICMFGLQ